jgi:hypothetical protein
MGMRKRRKYAEPGETSFVMMLLFMLAVGWMGVPIGRR